MDGTIRQIKFDVELIEKLRDKFGSKVVEGDYIPLGDVDNFFRVHGIKEPSVNMLIAMVVAMRDLSKNNKLFEGNDLVNQPSHYQVNERECIVEMLILFGTEDFIKYCTINAWKYRYRAGNKGDASEDLKKADRYIEYAYRAGRLKLWGASPAKLTDDAWWAKLAKEANAH